MFINWKTGVIVVPMFIVVFLWHIIHSISSSLAYNGRGLRARYDEFYILLIISYIRKRRRRREGLRVCIYYNVVLLLVLLCKKSTYIDFRILIKSLYISENLLEQYQHCLLTIEPLGLNVSPKEKTKSTH